ncbi:MAG: creatininase family protein, partial [Chloroflexota bacterium]
TKARAEKAYPGVEAAMEFMVKLICDILERFPAGQLPPVDKVTQRDPKEIEALMKGPLNGGKHIYTVAYPP